MRLTFMRRQGVLQLRRREREGETRDERRGEEEVPNFQSRQIEFRGSVRPTQPLTRSPMWRAGGRSRSSSSDGGGGGLRGDGGDGFRVNGITRVTGWTIAGGRGEGRRRGEGINHFVRKVRSIILISIDGGPSTLRAALPFFLPLACLPCTTRRDRRVIRGKERFCEMDAVPMPRRPRQPSASASVHPSEHESARFHSAMTKFAREC